MVKKTRKFNYQKDLKKKWKKEKEKKNPKVNTDRLKDFWNENKSVRFNYTELGLSMDPNQTLEIPKTKTRLLNPEIMKIEDVNIQTIYINRLVAISNLLALYILRQRNSIHLEKRRPPSKC
jgi:hypothetical protein